MRSLAALAFLVTACSPDFDLPAKNRTGGPLVSVEPIGSLDAAPAVFRLRVAGGARRSALSDYRLFSGELGAYHLGRIRARSLPGTLLEREIPVLAWAEAKDAVVAPLEVLVTGKYALASPELGLVAEVVVDSGLVPVLERSWPASDTTSAAGTMVFCGDVSGASPGSVVLAPTGVRASIGLGLNDAGAFSDACLRVELDEPADAGAPLLPPALTGEVLLAPRVLVLATDGSGGAPCPEPEVALGPVCGKIADDRVELHSYQAPAFVAFEKPERLLGVVRPLESLVLRGFAPSSVAPVSGLAFDAAGELLPIELEISTASLRPHVVLNEVLANPAGPEASSEWIEIVNDGSVSVDLDGFVLDDAIDPTVLPAHELAPREMALLVPTGYFPDPELDLVPAPDVPLLVLPRLGRSGLANAGELLRLRDRDGNVVSRFPARPSPGPGRSVARRTPEALDAESASFGDHADPGASPGAANVLEDE